MMESRGRTCRKIAGGEGGSKLSRRGPGLEVERPFHHDPASREGDPGEIGGVLVAGEQVGAPSGAEAEVGSEEDGASELSVEPAAIDHVGVAPLVALAVVVPGDPGPDDRPDLAPLGPVPPPTE